MRHTVAVQNTPTETEDWTALGRVIRERRLARSLTLVALARQVGLSQPFLSQVENGRARPSLMSLHRIAEALDTTPQAFFGGTIVNDRPLVVRAADVRLVDVDSSPTESTCHLLLAGGAPFHLLEFDGLPSEFLEYFTHDGFEATYVIRGHVEIDIDGTITRLGPGDSISYPSRLPHRLRSTGKQRSRVLLIETKVEAIQDRSAGEHAPARQPKSKRRTPPQVPGAKRTATGGKPIR